MAPGIQGRGASKKWNYKNQNVATRRFFCCEAIKTCCIDLNFRNLFFCQQQFLPVFLSRLWVSKLNPKILQWHPKFSKPRRYGFALYWNKTICGQHVFLHMAISTVTAMIGQHISLAQKLEVEITRRYLCIVMHTASLRPVAILPQICTVYENVKVLQWKCFTVSPLRSACLAMY